MEFMLTARYVHTGYNLDAVEGEQSIAQALTSVLPRGSIVEITIKAKTTGESRGLCAFKTKYGTCHNVLEADGTCSDREHNAPLDAALTESV